MTAITVPVSGATRVHLRPPQNRDELWQTVRFLTGIEIPRQRFCHGHMSPFDAFADAYFAVDSMAVWKASRGFGGKSYLLALLAYIESIFLDAEVYILGGSGEQARRVQRYQRTFWQGKRAPAELLVKILETGRIEMANIPASCTALMASQTSVRGAHGTRLRLDEVDEMPIEHSEENETRIPLFDAAMGQTLGKANTPAQTVASSTHQYADGAMTEILRRADENGWRVYEWCYRETQQPHGWLSLVEIARKRREVPRFMWETEYDLQEPAVIGRAFAEGKIDDLFSLEGDAVIGADGEYIEFEPPVSGGRYSTGADWAKEHDWTVISTLRLDVTPSRVVAFERTGRRPWPVMCSRLDARHARYGGAVVHDATGLGDVVDDYLQVPNPWGIWLSGKARSDVLSAYINAVEHDEIRSRRIDYARREHLYATVGDIYGHRQGEHLPDTVCSLALAWAGRELSPEIRSFDLSGLEKVSEWRT